MITCPVPRLKNIQRRLLHLIEEEYFPKKVVHGFVQGKSIKSNALEHVDRQFVLNVDLQDFFPSIHFGRVSGLFMAEPFNLPREVANVIAKICCFEKQLPQGAPTSPIISNLICRRLDSHLRRLASSANCRYSRYADDITISAGRYGKIEKFATYVGSELILSKKFVEAIERNDFRVRSEKSRLQGVNSRQMVTGLVTNQKVNVPRKFIRNIRAMLHNAEVNGVDQCQSSFEKRRGGSRTKGFLSLLRGRVEFIRHIRGENDPIYLAFASRLLKISPNVFSSKEKNRIALRTDSYNSILDSLWVVDAVGPDKSEPQLLSTAVALTNGGLLTCAHCVPVGYRVSVYRRDESRYANVTVSFRDDELDLAILEDSRRFGDAFEIADSTPSLGTAILLAGFPHYSKTNLGVVERGTITGNKSSVDGHLRLILSIPVLTGNSGGPILNDGFEIVGIAAKGNSKLTREEDNNQPEAIRVESIHKFLEAFSESK